MVNNHRTAHNFTAIQSIDSRLSLAVIRHLDKTKAFGSASFAISNDLGRINLPVLSKKLLQVFNLQPVVKVANENIHGKKKLNKSKMNYGVKAKAKKGTDTQSFQSAR